MSTLNLGILAHVDAGKTSLTERLLFDTGVIERLGSVDAGDTQTDTNEIERRRGITIRTAVASFTVGDLQVNLVDTPGHPDFIAEVERALAVLDAAVLVVSAVEGIQAQTRVLMRTLRRLRLPTLVFVNKIDRAGARAEELLADLTRKLSLSVLAMNSVHGIGTRRVRTVPCAIDDGPAAEVLAEHDDALLAELVDGVAPAPERLRKAVAAQTADGRLCPVVFGSALLGEGIGALLDTLRLLPAAPGGAGALDGLVFAIEHEPGGKRLALVRLYSGELRPRQRITFQRREADGGASRQRGKVTAVEVVGSGAGTLAAGNIARIGGLPGIRVGDRIGSATRTIEQSQFARPALEALVTPRSGSDVTELRHALSLLAERDPLIGVRPLPGGETSVLLYGEVQKEVIGATLRHEFGIEARFARSQIVHLERPVRTGEAYEEMSQTGFWATVGLRVAPGPAGSGVEYRIGIQTGVLLAGFHRAVEDTVRRTLEQGRYGWPVTGCTVTLIRGRYSTGTTAADFRNLTPLVLMAALSAAGTRVFEPCHRFELEVPADALGTVVTELALAEAELRDTRPAAGSWLLEGDIPARRTHEFQQRLPGLTHGEGAWSSRPYGDRPVRGPVPVRARTGANPFDRREYLQYLRQHGHG
jgi:ribosomal protection tetracycline resistance protein